MPLRKPQSTSINHHESTAPNKTTTPSEIETTAVTTKLEGKGNVTISAESTPSVTGHTPSVAGSGTTGPTVPDTITKEVKPAESGDIKASPDDMKSFPKSVQPARVEEEANTVAEQSLTQTLPRDQKSTTTSPKYRIWGLYGSWGPKTPSSPDIQLLHPVESTPESEQVNQVDTDLASSLRTQPLTDIRDGLTSEPSPKPLGLPEPPGFKRKLEKKCSTSLDTAPPSVLEPIVDSNPSDQQPQPLSANALPDRPRSGWYSSWWVQPAQSDPDPQAGEDKDSTNPPSGPDQPLQNETDTTNKDNEEAVVSSVQAERSSWFGLWGYSPPNDETKILQVPDEPDPADTSDKTAPEPGDDRAFINTGPEPNQPSGWSFWSRQSTKADGGHSHTTTGELSVLGTPSQSHPVSVTVRQGPDPKIISKPPGSRSSRDGNKTAVRNTKTAVGTLPSARPNILLPEFDTVFSPNQSHTYWQSMKRIIMGDPHDVPHVSLSGNVPAIRRAVSIGIHGYFPHYMVNKVIGSPTGTSIKFAHEGAAAIVRWVESQGYGSTIEKIEIEKIAIESEGSVEERVNALWTLLLNSADHIKSADLVLISCHSQGVPVSIRLISKLIDGGYIKAGVKVGVCAMAGVNTGPFAFSSFPGLLLDAAAKQLFKFSEPESDVSKSYDGALDTVLRSGVKITYIGSLDDQLVPLDSATCLKVLHPNIYRAVFVDGRRQHDGGLESRHDFLLQLIDFTYRLINLGGSDHGFIRGLSPSLAGSWMGEGHSLLYFDPQVYDLALRFTLETTTSSDITSTPSRKGKSFFSSILPSYTEFRTSQRPASTRRGPSLSSSLDSSSILHPYFLPWALRGVLEQDLVRKQFSGELPGLLDSFLKWRPTTKPLKEIQYKLDVIRSKL